MLTLYQLKALRSLKNKIVLVTGGSSGIGNSVAYEAAKRGAIVVVVARNLRKLNYVAKKCLILSGRPAFPFAADLTNPDQVDSVLAQITREVGSVDILVNAAGFGDMSPLIDESKKRMQKMVQLNLLALMYLSRQASRQMISQGYGAIVNIGSIAGKIPTPNSSVYSATKAGVISFSNILRMEVADYGIQVLTVNPGPVETKFFDKADPSGNYLSHLPKRVVLDSTTIAKRIWGSIGYPVREINIPWYFNIAILGYHIAPGLGDWAIKKFFDYK